MADINDNISLGGFSIQDTMDMGVGNQELLQGLYEPETASASPEGVTPIIKDAEPPKPEVKPEVPKGKEIDATKDGEEPSAKSLITNFLGDNSGDEEEETLETKKPESSEETNEDISGKGTQFSALANDLFKLGVFNKDEGEEDVAISTPEEFLERFNSEKKKGSIEMVENFLGQFGEDYRNAFEAIYVKGVDPKEYFGTYNTIVNFAEIDLSKEDNQVKVMRQALADQGFEAEDIETEVERLKNYGDLETVSTRHHKVLVKKEAQKLHEMEAKSEEELRQKTAIKNQYIQNVQGVLQDKLKAKEFDGIPLNPKLAGELQDFLLVDKWKTNSGETLTDFDRTILDLKRPENHSMKVKVALLLKILEKDPTLSTIQKTGVTKKTDTLFSEVARQTTSSKSGGSSQANTNKWFI